MKVLYFTSTGNSLWVARKFTDEPLSIVQLLFYVMGYMFCLSGMEQPDYDEVASIFDQIGNLKYKYRSASGSGNRALLIF